MMKRVNVKMNYRVKVISFIRALREKRVVGELTAAIGVSGGVSGRVRNGRTTKLGIRFTEPGTKPSSFNFFVVRITKQGLTVCLFCYTYLFR